MARKGQPSPIKPEQSFHGKGSSEQSSPTLSVSSPGLGASATRREHQSSRASSSAKRIKVSSVVPGVTITHLEAIGECVTGNETTPPQWFYSAINQIIAPILSRLTELEQRVTDLDTRQADLEARFSDHRTIFITRCYFKRIPFE